ncbi:MAG TPA: hypothetical protein VFP68_01390, partial [Burkholderiaceae bacterium]|nr:hypothetical protein [Burkholderiaceae bacterium]
PSDAVEIRERTALDTPRTIEVREFLRSTSLPGGADNSLAKYRRALEKNAERQEDSRWADMSMQRAAGISRSDAAWIREQREPDSPRTRSIRMFLNVSAPPGQDSSASKYRRALERNHHREEGQKWPDKSMKKAAGIKPSHAKENRERWIAEHTANDKNQQARGAASPRQE